MNSFNVDSWEHILAKMDFCKLLINLLVFEYNNNTYDNIEGFLVLDFIDKQQIYLSKLYQIEFNNLKKLTVINPEFNYESLSNNQKIILMFKSILNILSRQFDNKNYILYNKITLLNLFGYMKRLKKYYKINIKKHTKIFKFLYDTLDSIE